MFFPCVLPCFVSWTSGVKHTLKLDLFGTVEVVCYGINCQHAGLVHADKHKSLCTSRQFQLGILHTGRVRALARKKGELRLNRKMMMMMVLMIMILM